jgi:hypothetical protein
MAHWRQVLTRRHWNRDKLAAHAWHGAIMLRTLKGMRTIKSTTRLWELAKS